MSVALRHHQTVLVSPEEVGFVQHFISTSSAVALSLDVDISAPLPIDTKSSCLLLVGVKINNQGKPECVDLILRKSIEIRLRL